MTTNNAQISSSLPKKELESEKGNISLKIQQSLIDEDDDLLSYDSSIDHNQQEREEIPKDNDNKDNDLILPKKIEIPSNPFSNLEDDHNLVYSSDEDSTLIQILTPMVALTPNDEDKGNSNSDQVLSKTDNDKVKESTSVLNTESVQTRSNIDIANFQGQSPLTIASMNCLAEALKMFISGGCDVNLQDINGVTPLHFACMNSKSKEKLVCINLLLDNGAMVNHQDNQGCTPLHKAAEHECTECISTLLSFGACPKIQDNLGNIPLHEATKASNTKAIRMLLEAKDSPESCAYTSLISQQVDVEGSVEGHAEQYEEQKESNFDFEPHDEEFLPPNPKSMEIWNRFFENTSANFRDESLMTEDDNTEQQESISHEKEYFLHDAVNTGDINCIRSLLETGHDVNEMNKSQNSPLHLAAYRGDLSAIVTLVENGAEVHSTNMYDETPLNICCSKDFTRCIDFLLCHEKESSFLFRYMNFQFVVQSLRYFLSTFLGSFIDRFRPMSRKQNVNEERIPENAAISLSSAIHKPGYQKLEPPEDVKIALEKAGLSLNQTNLRH
jgi:ankyrin repeat protein